MARKDIPDWMVCLAYWERSKKQFGNTGPWPYVFLQEWTGQCEKVCCAAMERAEDRGLLDCGVSLRGGWLTDEGKALLAGMDAELAFRNHRNERTEGGAG